MARFASATDSFAQAGLLHKTAFMPSDRHAEGLAGDLTIRENAALAALDRFATMGIMNREREMAQVGRTFASLAVKAPSIEAAVSSLSGGNQQKVVMARALLAEPRMIICRRADPRRRCWRAGRDLPHPARSVGQGTPVVVNSSDAVELEGLCDKVLVLSRGRVVEVLTGEDVREDRIVSAAVSAATHDDHCIGGAGCRGRAVRSSGWRHLAQLDNAPVLPLLAVIVLLAAFGYSQNSHFLSPLNLSNILLLATALGFVALGQTVAPDAGGHRPVGRAADGVWPS